jgi:hypothetical protein
MEIQSIFQANRKSTDRMRRIVKGLSNKELSQTTGNDWPIFITLSHLAFWDQRVIHVIGLAKKNAIVNAPLFNDQLNDIMAPILEAIPPEVAVGLAIKMAGELDQLLEETPQEIIQQMMTINSRLVERSLHRNSHLDDIEAMLQGNKYFPVPPALAVDR